MCLSCQKTPIKVCKNSFVKKSEKSLPWQQCIKSPSEISRYICLAQHLPQTDGERNYESVCQVLSSFLWQVSGSSGMPVKLVTLYIYKYIYMYIYRAVRSRGRSLQEGANQLNKH